MNDKKNDGKYIINTKTGTLHIVDGCYYVSKGRKPFNCKLYATEDDAIIDNQKYFKHCVNCFKSK